MSAALSDGGVLNTVVATLILAVAGYMLVT